MSLKFKNPESLKFEVEEFKNAESKEIESTFEEISFLKGEQITGIELERLKGKRQDRKERKKYARDIFRFIWIWCAGIFVIMVCNGLGWFNFTTSVLITLITTTTANILALFAIVANYLFFRDKKK